jgi:hypothetical protein
MGQLIRFCQDLAENGLRTGLNRMYEFRYPVKRVQLAGPRCPGAGSDPRRVTRPCSLDRGPSAAPSARHAQQTDGSLP